MANLRKLPTLDERLASSQGWTLFPMMGQRCQLERNTPAGVLYLLFLTAQQPSWCLHHKSGGVGHYQIENVG